MKKLKYINQHASLAFLIIIFTWIVDLAFTKEVIYFMVALGFLVGAEYGEFKGKAKAFGLFKNNLKENWKVFKDSVGNFWQISQSIGATVLAFGLFYLLKVIV